MTLRKIKEDLASWRPHDHELIDKYKEDWKVFNARQTQMKDRPQAHYLVREDDEFELC